MLSLGLELGLPLSSCVYNLGNDCKGPRSIARVLYAGEVGQGFLQDRHGSRRPCICFADRAAAGSSLSRDRYCFDLLPNLRGGTHSTPEYKACVARAADKADQLLNESYKKLQDAAVSADAKDMRQSPGVQLGYLKDA